MPDRLIEAMRAAPDDDAPRLVWADREGGEQGELVVIQCALAGTLSTSERRRLVQRERELLLSLEASLDLGGLVTEPVFARGFVDGARVAADVLAVSAALTALERLSIRADARFERLEELAAASALAGLRELELYGHVDDAVLRALARATFAPKLRRLFLDTSWRYTGLSPVAYAALSSFPALEQLTVSSRTRGMQVLARRIPDVRVDDPAARRRAR